MSYLVVREELPQTGDGVFFFDGDPEPYRQFEDFEEFIGYNGSIRGNTGGRKVGAKPENRGSMLFSPKDGGERRRRSIHRAIALAWLPWPKDVYGNPVPYGILQADHIDNIKANDSVSNCQWLTNKENSQKARGLFRRNRNLGKNAKWMRHEMDHPDHVCNSEHPPFKIRTCKKCGRDAEYAYTYPSVPDYNEEFRTLYYMGLYFTVSNWGRVVDKGKYTYGSLEQEYLTITRKVLGKNRRFRVHRLVLLAFHGDPPDDQQTYTTDHIDINSVHNCIHNLRWATASEQVRNCNSEHLVCPCRFEGEEMEFV